MNSDEQDLRASERFDETAGTEPGDAAELEAWGDFALIADHLQSSEPVALPVDFAQQVQRKIRQVQRRRDAVLVLQTAFVTGLILTFVAAAALGFNWWQRLLTGVQPENVAALVRALSASFADFGLDLRQLQERVKPFIRLLPGAFLCAAIAALLIEIAVFRLLRIGPFRLKPALHQSSHDSLS
jgi:hypothetical protein